MRKGQEWEHTERLARGPDMPDLLDDESSLDLNNLWLGLCRKESQPTALRGAQHSKGLLLNQSVDCSLTLELTRKICEETWPSVVAAAADASLSS